MSSPHDESSPVGLRPPEYRLPESTQVGSVCLQVADIEQSLQFYEEVLGFKSLDRSGNRAKLGVGEDEQVLVELAEQPGVRPVPRRGHLGLFHVAFLLPDRASLGTFLRHLRNMNIQPGLSDHLVSEAIYLHDPDGLGIEVYADRPRSSWQHDGRQIVMTTEPLDVQDLIKAAGDNIWTEAPRGTRVGHLHLRVGDLEEAAGFYHEALGFDKTVWNYPGALFMAAGGYHHHLGTNTWAGAVPPAADSEARLVEWTLRLPRENQVDAAANSLDNAGFAVTRKDGDLLTADPWGTALRLTSDL